MPTEHVIAMDTHSQTTDICMQTRVNGPCRRWRVPTRISEIIEVLESIPGPRILIIEEGPLAGWLRRNLRSQVDKILVCDPRKNGFVAGGGGGDKTDAVDAQKLCHLYWMGYLKEVYHAESLTREVAKEAVGLYHERVQHRVRSANKVMGLLKRWGIMARETAFKDPTDRPALLTGLPAQPAGQMAAGHMALLWQSYDEAKREERELHREVVKLGKQEEVVVRWQAVPGIGWIRGMTLLAYLDTPWRFRNKQALWKYLGIGLIRESSGTGQPWVHVALHCNRVLKNAILGAAESVLMKKIEPFYGRYENWRSHGLNHRNARRMVARDLAQIIWAMWKTGREYQVRLIGGKVCSG